MFINCRATPKVESDLIDLPPKTDGRQRVSELMDQHCAKHDEHKERSDRPRPSRRSIWQRLRKRRAEDHHDQRCKEPPRPADINWYASQRGNLQAFFSGHAKGSILIYR